MSDFYDKALDAYLRGAGITVTDRATALAAARAKGLKTHYFKRSVALPRVRRVLGFLSGIAFSSLLDVGSGRGVFLWPFLETFSDKEVHCVDPLPHRAELHRTVAAGGVFDLHSHEGDVRTMDLPDGSVDVVTMLEVLEHIPDVAGAIRNAVRMARQYVVATVPAKADDNPEHIHLLTKDVLTDLFNAAGCRQLHFGGVPNHLFMVATCKAC